MSTEPQQLPLRVSSVPFRNVSKFTQIDVDYASDPASFIDFISLIPNLVNFGKALTNRSGYPTEREVLVDVLRDQYAQCGQTETHWEGLLDPSHFTIVTAHQPSLFTGPLFFIYKICSTINLARQVTSAYPAYHIHPVFILGGEDHDFAEVNHLHLFGKEYKWETTQTGSVGRMSVDQPLMQLIDDLRDVFGQSRYSGSLITAISNGFREGVPYSQAMQRLLLELFRGTGLIVLNMDDPRLKKRFVHVLREELLGQTAKGLIEQSQKALGELGYKPQTYQREINLFYLRDQFRARIVQEGETFKAVDTEYAFSTAEILAELESHPERFSPNVNLRPLYQEILLPNLAYIGGGGELAYWLERKILFEYYQVPMPILVRRNSVLYLDEAQSKQRRKLDIPAQILFDSSDQWVAAWLKEHAESEIDITSESTTMERALESIVLKARSIDPTLANKYEAESLKILKDIEHLGKRLVRAAKAQNETRISQITKLHDKLHPSGKLQERHESFIPHYLRHGRAYIDALITHLDPLFNEVLILEEMSGSGE